MITGKKISRYRHYTAGFFVGVLFLISGMLYAQNFSTSTMMDQNTLSSALQMRQKAESATPKSITGTYSSINPEEYMVDSGDEFLITIDVQGPEIMVYNLRISSDGFLSIPNLESILIRDKILVEAIQEVKVKLKSKYPDAMIEVNMDKIHPIHVHITGALLRMEKMELTSGNRLHDAIENIINVYHEDTLLTQKFFKASLRNVSIIRDSIKQVYDILRFRNAGVRAENPYLMDDDVVNIAYRDTTGGDILVSGLVGRTMTFDFKHGDDLETALQIAGGLMPTADSAHISIARYTGAGLDFRNEIVDFRETPRYPLRSDDRIYVRRKPEYHLKSSVTVKGEIKYPGDYPIVPEQTTLSEIIRQCGGFTEFADLSTSRIMRNSVIPGEDELKRISKSTSSSISVVEKSYWASSTQQELNVVQCNFTKLFEDDDAEQDVILKHEDEIEIGSRKEYIYISGAIVNPGIIKYDPQWTYQDYVDASGGFKHTARKRRVILIKYRTNAWVEVQDDVPVEAGDRLFVPQKQDRTIQENVFSTTLTTISQIFTIVLVLINLRSAGK